MTAYSNSPPTGFGSLDYFNRQADRWYALMQRTAVQFAGGAPSAGDLAQAWRDALAGEADTAPFLGMFQGVLPGAWQDAGLQELQRWLQAPTFGLAREHQERWQALALAQQDYQRKLQAYDALMKETLQRALQLFERRLDALRIEGGQVEQLRALFDLWIDAAEEAYAEVALSPRFRSAYGALINAQMRVQAGVQREVEQVCARFGMPTRTEIDAAHQRINQLERALRRAGVMAGSASAPFDDDGAQDEPDTAGAAERRPPVRRGSVQATRSTATRSPAKRTRAATTGTGKGKPRAGTAGSTDDGAKRQPAPGRQPAPQRKHSGARRNRP